MPQHKDAIDYYARIIFVNAAALNTNLILLNSTSSRFPNGWATTAACWANTLRFITTGPGYLPALRWAQGIYHRWPQPNIGLPAPVPERGAAGNRLFARLRRRLWRLPQFRTKFGGCGQKPEGTTAEPDNRTLEGAFAHDGRNHPEGNQLCGARWSKKDEWGIPLLKIAIDYDDNDEKMIKDYQEQMSEMFTKAGFTDIAVQDSKAAPGLDIHEMGGVRMGRDPKTSLLNEWNQLHHCKNVFVTDGACMTSTSTQNPSLTYMALTARAADHAFSELKRGTI
jgi:hypothetical protein